MKKWLLSTLALAVVATTTATTVAAAEVKQPYSKLKKQIGIMSNIIESSLSEDSRSNRSMVNVEGVYLKAQGIVFDVTSGRGFSRIFRQHGRDMDFDIQMPQIAPLAPIAPLPPIGMSEDFADDIEAVVSRSMEVYEEAMESTQERSEYTRELREEQRELSYELRNYARRQRDLEFEVRHANDDRKKDLQENLTELKAEMAKLEQKNSEITARAKEEEKSLNEKKSKRAEQSKQLRQQYYAKLEGSIASTLCDYGAGLRQLAKNEYVTFVIDMNDAERGRHGNNSGNVKKIYSFSKKDIVACVMEDKTPAQLLAAGNAYVF
jgi:predicted transposase YbfD/YdcC